MNGNEFKAARVKLRYTQKELAKNLGVGVRAVQSWEQGWRPVNKTAARLLLTLTKK